jgi:DNA-binding transcriptional MocR family regulator
MEPLFAERMKILRASDIREILKITQRPEVISFAGGLPAPEFFPTQEIAEVACTVLQRDGTRALQYSPTEGDHRLRIQISSRLNAKWNTTISPDEVIITTGSQQGLDLIGKVFIDIGDAVACESPTYLGAVMAFNTFRPRWLEIPTDDEGMNMEVLENAVKQEKRLKFIYVVPNFQNPSGRTWSLRRRQQLMEIAARHEIPVIEDNPYGEVRFAGEPIPAIQSLPEGDLVISLGTLSKVFCPGLRIGWIAARRQFLDKLTIVKQGADLHSSTFDQMVAAEYLAKHDIDENIRRITAAYRIRRDVMVAALEREMPPSVRFSRPEGGLFLWVELPGQIDARALLVRCLKRDVAFVPGGSFFPAHNRENTLRLNFSNMSEDRIREGVARLATVLKEMLAEDGKAAGAMDRTAASVPAS